MADTEKKLTSGQKFMADLQIATQSKEDMLNLAAETIRQSHNSELKYSERGIPESSTALDMRATFIYAKMSAKTISADMNSSISVYNRKDLSTDQRLILIKQRYQKLGFGDFDNDFKEAFPKEFGVKGHADFTNVAMAAKRSTLEY